MLHIDVALYWLCRAAYVGVRRWSLLSNNNHICFFIVVLLVVESRKGEAVNVKLEVLIEYCRDMNVMGMMLRIRTIAIPICFTHNVRGAIIARHHKFALYGTQNQHRIAFPSRKNGLLCLSSSTAEKNSTMNVDVSFAYAINQMLQNFHSQ